MRKVNKFFQKSPSIDVASGNNFWNKRILLLILCMLSLPIASMAQGIAGLNNLKNLADQVFNFVIVIMFGYGIVQIATALVKGQSQAYSNIIVACSAVVLYVMKNSLLSMLGFTG